MTCESLVVGGGYLARFIASIARDYKTVKRPRSGKFGSDSSFDTRRALWKRSGLVAVHRISPYGNDLVLGGIGPSTYSSRGDNWKVASHGVAGSCVTIRRVP